MKQLKLDALKKIIEGMTMLRKKSKDKKGKKPKVISMTIIKATPLKDRLRGKK
jgi:hypothetical protein